MINIHSKAGLRKIVSNDDQALNDEHMNCLSGMETHLSTQLLVYLFNWS